VLESAGVDAIVGQFVTRAVPKHVRVTAFDRRGGFDSERWRDKFQLWLCHRISSEFQKG